MHSVDDKIIVFLIVTTCVILLLVSFVITIAYLYRKKQLSYLEEVDLLKSEYEKTVLRVQVEIQEQVLQSISRDIHDNINLSLTLAKLNLNTLSLDDKATAAGKINTVVELVGSVITELSDISKSMNSDIIREQGLIGALQQEIERLEKLRFFSIHFEVNGNPIFLKAEKEVFIFRIVQESFNNILKHARAKTVQLVMNYGIDQVNIIVTDDGIGFIVNEGSTALNTNNAGAGLRNMRKRAELLNGYFAIDSHPQRGTTINISIPF